MNKVLKAREARSNLIIETLTNSSNNVIIIKANVVGENKNTYYSYLVVNIFFKLVQEKVKIIKGKFIESADGPFYLLEVSNNLKNIKEILINIEEYHPLGRIVDLDVYSKTGSISRLDLGKEFRKCIICDDVAHKCIRSRKHSEIEVKEKIESLVCNYLENIVSKSVDDAITMEANLDPKFGLVTSKTSGSHPDMDFHLLMKSKDAIHFDLVKMFFLGFDNELLAGFRKARMLGLDTERKMYKATNNINTYKGLIFILGITLVSLGYAIKNKRTDLFNLVKDIGKDLIIEFDNELNTFGKEAFIKYGISGARGEVHKGLISVRDVKKRLSSLNNEDLTMALIYLIKNVDDTVLLKRAKTLEKYYYFKELVGSINEYDLELIKKVTDECIENNISFGGSADLLITSIFLKLIERELVINYE